LQRGALKAICDAADYLETCADYMGYGEALAMGLPIATGVIEGACRYLMKDRMDGAGARWTILGAEAVLRLRALRTSGDFDATGTSTFEKNCVDATRSATPTVTSTR
jgi:hypothetical protein